MGFEAVFQGPQLVPDLIRAPALWQARIIAQGDDNEVAGVGVHGDQPFAIITADLVEEKAELHEQPGPENGRAALKQAAIMLVDHGREYGAARPGGG